MGQGTRPPIFEPGAHYHDCLSPLFEVFVWGVKSSHVTLSVPFNHKAIMVKIRSIFQLIISRHFISPKRIFYFNVHKEVSSSGTLSPDPPIRALPWTQQGASIPQTFCCVPQPWRQTDAYIWPTCNSALNAEHYTTATYSPRVRVSTV